MRAAIIIIVSIILVLLLSTYLTHRVTLIEQNGESRSSTPVIENDQNWTPPYTGEDYQLPLEPKKNYRGRFEAPRPAPKPDKKPIPKPKAIIPQKFPTTDDGPTCIVPGTDDDCHIRVPKKGKNYRGRFETR